jgi:hypothetical protein
MSCRLRAYIQSFTVEEKKYKIHRDDEKQEFTCTCPDWVYRKKDKPTPEERQCKHLKAIFRGNEHFFDRLILFSDEQFVEIDGEKWKVIPAVPEEPNETGV